MMMRAMLVLAGAMALVGCGGDFDGTYAGSTGLITAAVMTVDGDVATVDTINTVKRVVMGTREFEAEIRSGKLVLSRGGLTIVYGVAVDEQSLECLSDSCKGFGRMGAGGMPRIWKRYEKKDG